ncbi:hypothetical protein N7462_010755 [Penicillium macrosclerotiorum]|uniref:uncharacterized protein n=1 Tax=Penicillium macrosclerotiorum TaxID=303699 RepID=UPI0025479AC4|nr:uncharacterized protein N7462_010755 [Penicillium macrosclerotiorum]KAJ5669685.1 hypothetical protein N7462_010755 [Penicillium macrosclerotiorum]
MSVASGAYFAGPMQPNSQSYTWANRPFQPLQPPSGHLNQQFSPSHSYPSSGYPVGYNGQHGGPLPSYNHESSVTPSYLPGAPGSAPRHNVSRSPPIGRNYHPQSGPGALPEQPLMNSSPYMMNPPAYYLPEAPPIPSQKSIIDMNCRSSHPSSLSSPAPSMVTEPVFPQPDSVSHTEGPSRVISSRPRPQCWDHGCNGREFSTFSNLLRHQREKSGVVAKAECPICGAVFTRTTARNIHVAQGKCKGTGRESSVE